MSEPASTAGRSARIAVAIAGIAILATCTVLAVDRAVTVSEPYENVPFQKGMSFTTWRTGSFNTTETRQALDAMKAAGVEWVNINHWWWQDYLNSTEIKPDHWSDSYENMTACFEYARSIGLHVLYKPMLNLLKVYDWRSYIHYSPEWMGNYTAWMVEHAKAAEAGGVEILSIGCEMGNMQVHSADVRAMIARIREVYTGQLTYSANHDSYMHVDWWDAVDMIGISMYTPMAVSWDPGVDELRTAWDGLHGSLQALAARWRRPVVFTEIGIQARDGSAMIPNDNQISDRQDTAEMRDYYVSLFTSRIWRAPWFKGAHWWIWDLTEYREDLDGFNPVLVADTIAEHYAMERVVESIAVPLLASILPLAAGAAVLGWVLARRPSPLPGPGVAFPRRGMVGLAAGRGAGASPPPGGITTGLLLGAASAHVLTGFSTSLFGVVHESVSNAIILNLSPETVIGTFVALLAVALVAGALAFRFLPRYVLLVSFFLALAGPAVAATSVLAKAFVDALLACMLLAAIVVHHLNAPAGDGDLLRTVTTWAVVTATIMIIARFMGEDVQAVVAVPVGLALARVAGKDPPRLPLVIEPEPRAIPAWKPAGIEHLLVGTALLCGVIIPSGNSAVNLMHMTVPAIATYWFPSLAAAAAIAGTFLLLEGRGILPRRLDPRTWMTGNHAVLALGLLSLAGIPFLLAGRPVVAWAAVSGAVLVLVAGSAARDVGAAIIPRQAGRAYTYLFITSTCLVLGFIVNAVKGLLVYAATFLVFKDGQLLRRDPLVDPLPNFDVPLLLHGVGLAIGLAVACTLLLYRLAACKAWRRPFWRCIPGTG